MATISIVQAGFLDDVGNVVTAPIRAPIQATKDVLQGAPPQQIIRNQLDIQYAPQGRIISNGSQALQQGNDLVRNIPRNLIQSNFGGDWLKGYDTLTASQRVQQEIAFTSGRFLGQCMQIQQCGAAQFAAMPVAAAMRDAYKVYISHSSPLDPRVIRTLSQIIPIQVLMNARWAVGNTPDLTVPGFLNSGHSVFRSGHAVTLGNLMVFSQMPDLRNPDDWTWLIHELFHVEQYLRYSNNWLESIDGFAVDYIQNYNDMESEAQNNAVQRFSYIRPFM